MTGLVRVAAAAVLLVATTATSDEIVVAVDKHDGIFRVHAELVAAVPDSIAWAVLTDYDRIADFVGSVKRSASEHLDDGRLLLEQEGRVGVFVFRRAMRVQLEVSETERRTIEFHDLLLRDFHHYRGAWNIEPDSATTTVRYSMEARLRAAVPGFIGRRMISSNIRDMLGEVRAEMVRRASGVESGAGP